MRSEIPTDPSTQVFSGPSGEPSSPDQTQEFSLNIKEIPTAVPEAGGTVLVLQRNAKDNRDAESPDYGALLPEAQTQTQEGAKRFFDDLFNQLDEEGRKAVRVLVAASDAVLTTPGGINSEHRRGLETAEQDIKGILESMAEYGVSSDQLLNSSESDGSPVTLEGLIDLKLWQSPKFVTFMKEKYGTGKDLWVAYEDDVEVETREKMKAEGPSDIAIRMRSAVTSLTQDVAQEYHKENPNTRLVIYAVSHYDSISPFVKGYVYQANPTKLFVPVSYGGGISVKISPDNQNAETEINGETFQVPAILHKPENYSTEREE